MDGEGCAFNEQENFIPNPGTVLRDYPGHPARLFEPPPGPPHRRLPGLGGQPWAAHLGHCWKAAALRHHPGRRTIPAQHRRAKNRKRASIHGAGSHLPLYAALLHRAGNRLQGDHVSHLHPGRAAAASGRLRLSGPGGDRDAQLPQILCDADLPE